MALNIDAALKSMWPDERARFDQSYYRTGNGRSVKDFLLDHVALYQHAREDDPRHEGIYFGGAPLEQIMADPATRSDVMKRVAQQKKATPSLAGLKQAVR